MTGYQTSRHRSPNRRDSIRTVQPCHYGCGSPAQYGTGATPPPPGCASTNAYRHRVKTACGNELGITAGEPQKCFSGASRTGQAQAQVVSLAPGRGVADTSTLVTISSAALGVSETPAHHTSALRSTSWRAAGSPARVRWPPLDGAYVLGRQRRQPDIGRASHFPDAHSAALPRGSIAAANSAGDASWRISFPRRASPARPVRVFIRFRRALGKPAAGKPPRPGRPVGSAGKLPS